MLILTTVIHAVFASIFFFFHRYIEMSVVIGIFVIFLSKIIAPLDVLKRPAFLKTKTSESATLEQSIYVSSGILFYTALVGISLGISNALWIPVDLHLFYYCIFFLTSVIYGIYLISYPKNPNVFILFRTHSLLASTILNIAILASVLFGLLEMELLILINLFLVTIGLSIVLVLDRNSPLNTHILAVYAFVISAICMVIWIFSVFSAGVPLTVFGVLLVLTGLYIFFPDFLQKAYIKKNIHLLLWHFSNLILACSWAMFFYFFWAIFWGYMDDRLIISFSLFLLMGLWLWVYNTDDRNPIFFTGMISVLAVFYAFMTFEIIPPIFWMITVCLFVFAGGLVLVARFFRNNTEELILAGSSVIFLCWADIVLIFQENSLFALSTLFFFQSFLWYGAYEIFHRQANAKNRAL